jgi:hypothetical protein
MALLGSLCVGAAATFVRAHVEAGNKYDWYKLWSALKTRFTLRQALTQVGLLEQIMALPINETNVRQELPTWESAIQKFENRSGQVLSDTLKIGFLRKNLGPTTKNHLRLNSQWLTDYKQVRELIIEWNRFEDLDKARGSNGPLAMDIGWTGKGKGSTTCTSWNGDRKGEGKTTKDTARATKAQGTGFARTTKAQATAHKDRTDKGQEKESTTQAAGSATGKATQGKERATGSTGKVTTMDLSLWRLVQLTQRKALGLQDKKIGGPKRKNTTKVTLIGLMTPTIGGMTITAL